MNNWVIYAAACVIVMGAVYPLFMKMNERHTGGAKRRLISCLVKWLGTALCAGIAVYGATASGERASWLLVAGLAICSVADIVIVFSFIGGMGVFFAGHLFYLWAFFSLAPFNPMSIAIAILIAAPAAFLAFRHGAIPKNMPAPYFAYGAVLSLMAATAFFLPGEIGARGIVAAAGGVLFVVSDSILAASSVCSKRALYRLCMATYYPAQLLLALTAMFPALIS